MASLWRRTPHSTQAACESIYSGKAAEARAQVVRTLITQIERLSASLAELDAAMQALLPPPNTGSGHSDAQLLQSIPVVGPVTAAISRELEDLQRFKSAKALVAYVGYYPKIEQSGQRQARPLRGRLAGGAPCALFGGGQRHAAQPPVAYPLPA